jgi:hypothetical protein
VNSLTHGKFRALKKEKEEKERKKNTQRDKTFNHFADVKDDFYTIYAIFFAHESETLVF